MGHKRYSTVMRVLVRRLSNAMVLFILFFLFSGANHSRLALACLVLFCIACLELAYLIQMLFVFST